MSWRMPPNTDWAIKQNSHPDTLEYGREIHETVKKFKSDYIKALEIGCAWGVSTLAILMAGKGSLTSVDVNFQNHAHDEVEVNNFRTRWSFHNDDSKEFWRDNIFRYDLVYIDGSHKYPQCYEDLVKGWDCLNEDGILIADDYTHPKNITVDTDQETSEYGVSYSVCKLMQERPINKIKATKHLWIAFK